MRVYSLRLGRQWLSRRWFVAIGLCGWLVFYLGRVFGYRGDALLCRILAHAGMHWMAWMFLFSTCFFAVDLVTGFGWLWRSWVVHLRRLAAGLGAFLVLAAHIQGGRAPAIDDHEVILSSLPPSLDGTTIAVLSDLHVGATLRAGWFAARVAQVQALQPDMIVLVGDLFERHGDADELGSLAAQLEAPLGVWAVRGNHDRVRRDRRDLTGEVLQRAGIRLLENEAAEATPGLVVAGIGDLTVLRRQPGQRMTNLHHALADRPAGATLLLSHTPWLVAEAAAAGVGLMLSGHTHNGQLWPFNHLVRTRYPFISGRYEIDDMTLLVSRGAGVWGPRMRLWQRGDLLLVTMRSNGVDDSGKKRLNELSLRMVGELSKSGSGSGSIGRGDRFRSR